MILTHKGRRLITFDQDTKNFIDAAGLNTNANINSGGLYNAEQARMYVHYVVSGLKSIGIWNKMKAVYIFIGGTETTHKFNLKDPRDLDAAFRLTFPNGMTHNQFGIQGNGTNQYADTNLIPSSVLTNYNVHAGFYSTTSASQNSIDVESYPNNGTFLSVYNQNGSLFSVINTANSFATASANGNVGMVLGSKVANNSNSLYKNGILLNKDSTVNTSNLPSVNMIIGGRPLVSQYFSSKIYNFVTIGDGLTDNEVSQYSHLVQFAQGFIGRKV